MIFKMARDRTDDRRDIKRGAVIKDYINHIGPRGSHDTKVASAFSSYATVVASATPLWRVKRIGISLYRPVRAN